MEEGVAGESKRDKDPKGERVRPNNRSTAPMISAKGEATFL